LPSKTGQNGARLRDLLLFCFTVLLVLMPASSVRNGVKERMVSNLAFPVTMASAPQQLTATGKTRLYAIVDAAELADLRWPTGEVSK
jgi:hypothetical protein